MAELRQNTWSLDEWYDQAVAGTTGGYNGTGELYMWGDEDDGSLGLNSPSDLDRSSPTQVPGTNWVSHYKGNMSNFATKNDGTAWSWGFNQHGQLGQNTGGNPASISSPAQIGTDTTWSKDVNGKFSSMMQYGSSAIKSDGTLWSWGDNEYGFLGLNQPAPTRISSPVQVGSDSTWAILSDGMGYSEAGGVKTDGTLWMWGYGEEGTLGLNEGGPGAHRSSPVQIPGTTWSTDPQKLVVQSYGGVKAIKTDGTMWTWGYNGYSILGLSVPGSRSSPVQLPGTTWKYVNGRGFQVAAIKTDGTLWSWGYNLSGSLGHNNKTNYSSPRQVGSDNTWAHIQCFDYNNGKGGMLAVKTNGTLWSWGNNENGELGHNNNTDYSSPKQVPGTWAGTSLTSAKRFNSCLQIF